MSVMEKTSFLQEEIVIAEKHLRKLSQQLSDFWQERADCPSRRFYYRGRKEVDYEFDWQRK
jgi:hypothetical protein